MAYRSGSDETRRAAGARTASRGLQQRPRVVDMAALDYISSAGLGVLMRTQKRLMAGGSGLKLINVNHHIADIFRFSGFDQIFEISRVGE